MGPVLTRGNVAFVIHAHMDYIQYGCSVDVRVMTKGASRPVPCLVGMRGPFSV